MNLNNQTKVLLTIACFAIATIGFIAKLPSVFYHHDKALHALFYFFAAAFLNVQFADRKISRHVAIFIFLFLFGVAIEFGQYISKKVLHISHGNPDPKDVQSNLGGLILFSICWFVYFIIILGDKRLTRYAGPDRQAPSGKLSGE